MQLEDSTFFPEGIVIEVEGTKGTLIEVEVEPIWPNNGSYPDPDRCIPPTNEVCTLYPPGEANLMSVENRALVPEPSLTLGIFTFSILSASLILKRK